MAELTLYRITTGEIVGNGSFSAEIGRIGLPGCATVDGRFDAATHYVWEGTAEPRPLMVLTPSALTGGVGDTISIAGVPTGARVAINGGAPIDVAVVPLAFSLAEPGAYRLTLTCWPYVPAEITVTCT